LFFVSAFIKPVNNLKHLSIDLPSGWILSILQYSKSEATSRAASISMTDPLEISKNLFRSASDFRELPSDMFK
jgi:hypothetical protein